MRVYKIDMIKSEIEFVEMYMDDFKRSINAFSQVECEMSKLINY